MRKYTRLLTTATAVGLSTSLATGIAVAAPADNAEVNPETILGENFADIASTGEFSNLIDRIAKQAQDSQAFLDKLGGDLDSLFKGGDKDKDITAALNELRDVVNSLVTDFAPTESGESESTETGAQTGEASTEGAEGATEDTETQPEGTEAGEGESAGSGVDAGTQTGEDTDPKPEEGTSGSHEDADETDKTDADKKSDSAKELSWKIKVSDLTSAYGDKDKVEGQQMVLIDIPEGVDPLSIKVTRDGRDIVVGTSEDSTSIAVPAFSDQELEVTATVKDGETKNGVTKKAPKDIELSALALPVDKAGAIPKVDNTELSVLLNKAQQQGNISIENIYITKDGDILVGPDKKLLDLSDAAVGTTGSIEDIATSIISGETKVSDANSQLKSFVAALATLSDKASPEQKEKAAEYLREVMKTRDGEDSKSTDKPESDKDKSESDKDKTASDLDKLFEDGGLFSELFGGGADKEDKNESKVTDKDDKSDKSDKTDKTDSEDKTDKTDDTSKTGKEGLIDEKTAELIKAGLLGAGATLLISTIAKSLKGDKGLSSSADKTDSAKDLNVEELLKRVSESEKTGEKTTESTTSTPTTASKESETPRSESTSKSASSDAESDKDSNSAVDEPTDAGSTGGSGSTNSGSNSGQSGSTGRSGGGSTGGGSTDGYSEGYNDGYDDAAADGAEQPASPAEADYNNAAAESMPVTGMDSSTKILAGLAVALMVAAGAFIGIARRKTDQ